MEKKVIVLGVTGGIAAYKSAQLASNLLKKGYEVHVIMTKNATEFVTPLTFEVLTNNKVAVDTFDRSFDYNVNHVSLAKKADLFVVAPATANVIAKFAGGIADDMLTTNYLAFRCPTLVAPAMNTAMLEHIATQRNIEILRTDGVHFIQSGTGYLACGDIGAGRLADIADIEAGIEFLLTEKKLTDRKVVITAGPTQEPMDPVRFITNHSSGKMGYALARTARNLGADVVLITGPTHLTPPKDVEVVHVATAQEMYEAAMAHLDYDFFIASAAVSDYRPTVVSVQKLKKKEMSGDSFEIALAQNEDIVAQVAKEKKDHQKVAAFAMETENLLENARLKLVKKQVDLVVANDLFEAGAGFKGDTNKVTLITHTGDEELPLLSKDEVAHEIFERMLAL